MCQHFPFVPASHRCSLYLKYSPRPSCLNSLLLAYQDLIQPILLATLSQSSDKLSPLDLEPLIHCFVSPSLLHPPWEGKQLHICTSDSYITWNKWVLNECSLGNPHVSWDLLGAENLDITGSHCEVHISSVSQEKLDCSIITKIPKAQWLKTNRISSHSWDMFNPARLGDQLIIVPRTREVRGSFLTPDSSVTTTERRELLNVWKGLSRRFSKDIF